MITGQNSYAFSKPVDLASVSEILIQSAQALVTYFKEKHVTIHLVSFKDFYEHCAVELKKHHFSSLYEFNTQPNMIFNLPASWKTEADYVAAFSKKYRDQFKRAHKKIEGVEVRELDLQEVTYHEEAIYNLYHYVAQNAPFNTFFLAKNHFSTFKKQCGSRFRICGYFIESRLVGFHSLLLNDNVLETYFLGYDESIQKEKMLYLNMLYNMTKFGVEHGFEKIIFGRTALEIKSSIGATPIQMSGFIYHTNYFINKLIPKLFKRLEPETAWQQRHPFK